MRAHQRPITISVRLLPPFVVHPPATVDKITEDVQERLFDKFFSAHNGLSIPTERRQRLLRLLQFPVHLGRLGRPGRDLVRHRRTELQRCTQVLVRPREPGG